MKMLFTMLLVLPLAIAGKAQQKATHRICQDTLAKSLPQIGTVQLAQCNSTATLVKNGPVTTIIRPNGKVTTKIKNGNTSTIVNPDGSHSVLINNGAVSTLVNSNGTHSVVINNGSTSIVVNPDGSHTVIVNP